jgi:hypothetical protein
MTPNMAINQATKLEQPNTTYDPETKSWWIKQTSPHVQARIELRNRRARRALILLGWSEAEATEATLNPGPGLLRDIVYDAVEQKKLDKIRQKY